MPNTLTAPLFSEPRRRELLERAQTLRSGREKPGRYWKIDLETLELPEGDQTPEAPKISTVSRSGVVAADMATALAEHRETIARALGTFDPGSEKFAAYAAAKNNAGAFVYVAADISVDEPVVIDYNADSALFPYTLIVLERGARCSVVERIRGNASVCGITHVVAAENAQADVASIQDNGSEAHVLYTRVAKPSKDARVNFGVAELGSALSVGSINVDVDATGVEANVAALFFPTGTQHVDLISTVAHNAGESRSETIVKSAAAGRGQARFLGNIRIAERAQASEAFLRDDALLLSRNAHIDSIPALEIAANEVRAYHGATVGAIDEEQLFYMTSRGIERKDAETMIALGFFEPAIARFPTEALREEIRDALKSKVA